MSREPWPNSRRICCSGYCTKKSSGAGGAGRACRGGDRGREVRRSCHPVKVGYKMSPFRDTNVLEGAVVSLGGERHTKVS